MKKVFTSWQFWVAIILMAIVAYYAFKPKSDTKKTDTAAPPAGTTPAAGNQ